MGKPKVTYFGEVLIDLTEDTVDAAHLVKGYTAHGADGEPVVGEYEGRTLPALSNPAARSLKRKPHIEKSPAHGSM